MTRDDILYALAKQVPDMERGFEIHTSYGAIVIPAGPLADCLQAAVRKGLQIQEHAARKLEQMTKCCSQHAERPPTWVPNPLFPTTADHGDFLRALIRPNPRAVQRVVERALANPESYRAQTASLRADIERLALEHGMSDLAASLRALCTGSEQSPARPVDPQGGAPK